MHAFYRSLIACFAAATTTAFADVQIQTALDQGESIAIGPDTTLQIDLANFFVENRPIANFNLLLPVETGLKELTYGGTDTALLMTYQLVSGASYDSFSALAPADFVWNNRTIQYQLLRDFAPLSVENFIAYANAGAYTNTIIHRSQISVLQGGGWTHNGQEADFLDTIEAFAPIPLERAWHNIEGSLAMARQSDPNSATSQFYINVKDNTDAFSDFDGQPNYAVFGDLLDPGTSLPLLKQMEAVPVWNLATGTAFENVPIYSILIENVESWIHFNSITISGGTPGGVVQDWTFIDPNDDGQITASELTNQDVFDITIVNGRLNIDRHDSGQARIQLTARAGNQTADFEIDLVGYNPEALEAFGGASIFQEGFIQSDWYGFLAAEQFPFVQHVNHGWQYVVPVGASPSESAYFLYDYRLGYWLYTTPEVYPALYAYGLGEWIWYYQGTGNGVNENRWFRYFLREEYFQDGSP